MISRWKEGGCLEKVGKSVRKCEKGAGVGHAKVISHFFSKCRNSNPKKLTGLTKSFKFIMTFIFYKHYLNGSILPNQLPQVYLSIKLPTKP